MKITAPLIFLFLSALCNAYAEFDSVVREVKQRQLFDVWNVLFFVKKPNGGGGGSSSGSGGGGGGSSGGDSGGDGDDDSDSGGDGGDEGETDGSGGSSEEGGGGVDGSISSEARVSGMSSTTMAMLVAAAAAAALAIGAVAMGQRRRVDKAHNLKGSVAKRMSLFGGHAKHPHSRIERPSRRAEMASSSDEAYSYQQHGSGGASV